MTQYIPLDVRANLWGQTFHEGIKLGKPVDECKELADGAVKAFVKSFRAEFKAIANPRPTMTQAAIDETLRRAEEDARANGQLPASLDS